MMMVQIAPGTWIVREHVTAITMWVTVDRTHLPHRRTFRVELQLVTGTSAADGLSHADVADILKKLGNTDDRIKEMIETTPDDPLAPRSGLVTTTETQCDACHQAARTVTSTWLCRWW
jgi:hypothetical protein